MRLILRHIRRGPLGFIFVHDSKRKATRTKKYLPSHLRERKKVAWQIGMSYTTLRTVHYTRFTEYDSVTTTYSVIIKPFHIQGEK